jgi:hypothetical protein
VEDITEAPWGTRVSPSTVSNLNKKIYAMAGYVGFAMKELTDSTTLIQLFASTEISTIFIPQSRNWNFARQLAE